MNRNICNTHGHTSAFSIACFLSVLCLPFTTRDPCPLYKSLNIRQVTWFPLFPVATTVTRVLSTPQSYKSGFASSQFSNPGAVSQSQALPAPSLFGFPAGGMLMVSWRQLGGGEGFPCQDCLEARVQPLYKTSLWETAMNWQVKAVIAKKSWL